MITEREHYHKRGPLSQPSIWTEALLTRPCEARDQRAAARIFCSLTGIMASGPWVT